MVIRMTDLTDLSKSFAAFTYSGIGKSPVSIKWWSFE